MFNILMDLRQWTPIGKEEFDILSLAKHDCSKCFLLKFYIFGVGLIIGFRK